MNTPRRLVTGLALVVLFTLTPCHSTLLAQTTAFTYQGWLQNGGLPADGLYELSFALHDAVTNGTLVGTPVGVAPVPVSNGLFTARLDFGAVPFTGANRWLEIAVTPFGSDQPPVTLRPRQPLLPVPLALHASRAAGLMTFDGAPLDLTVNGQRALRLDAGAGGSPNVIGGASVNGVAPGVIGATISGGGTSSPGFGATNRVEANYGTISGGRGHIIHDGSRSSTISGGSGNRINPGSGWSSIGGGESNLIEQNARYSVIGGGGLNVAGGSGSVIGGGSLNSVRTNAEHASIGGGLRNWVAADAAFSTIAGGNANTNSLEYATIGGGDLNRTAGFYATVGGGRRNVSSGGFAVVGGGSENMASGESSTVGGGSGNRAGHEASTVSGGSGNTADADYATVGGGSGNRSDGDLATVGGGLANANEAQAATIGGGEGNRIRIGGDHATISGGIGNLVEAAADWATIGGGGNNLASGDSATIGGGQNNLASAGAAVVGGGFSNTAAGPFATVGGGRENTADGDAATVPGGQANTATNHAFAAGTRAKAVHPGAFVWSDATGTELASTNANSWTVRSGGGARFFADSNATVGVQLFAGGFAWSPMSDRNVKENFQPVDSQEMLRKVVALPLATWNMTSQDPSIRHLGPMAQDFHAAFGLGESDRHINTVDADGVALAAIQGLNRKLEQALVDQATEIAQLRSANATLEARLAALERSLRVTASSVDARRLLRGNSE